MNPFDILNKMNGPQFVAFVGAIVGGFIFVFPLVSPNPKQTKRNRILQMGVGASLFLGLGFVAAGRL